MFEKEDGLSEEGEGLLKEREGLLRVRDEDFVSRLLACV